MPTSAAGNKPGADAGPGIGTSPGSYPRKRATRGFTLIELMVVVAIMAIASAGVVFALRDSAASQLEREGLRLAALLESARAQSRSNGQALRWRAVDGGFRFELTPFTGEGAAANPMAVPGLPTRWLSEDIRAQGNPTLVLGPAPILPPQSVVLESAALPGRPIQVSSDGVRPFHVGAPGNSLGGAP